MSLINKSRNFLVQIENNSRPIIFYIGSFISIINIRNFLEIFAYGEKLSLIRFFHYSLFWIFFALFLCLVLQIITKKKLKKVFKVVCSFYPVILIPPLFDIAFYGAGNFKITYLLPEHFEIMGFFNRLIYFGGSFEGSGVSLGMKVEFAIILALLFIYTYLSNKNIVKSGAVTLVVYILMLSFLSIATPISYFMSLIGGALTHLVLAQVIFVIILIFSTGLVIRNKKEAFLEFIESFKFTTFFSYSLAVMGGFFLGLTKDKFILDERLFFSIFFSILAILTLSGLERILPDSKELNLGFYLLLLAVIIISAFGGGTTLFFFIVIVNMFFLLYFPPFNLKKSILFYRLIFSLQLLVFIILGHSFSGESFTISNFIWGFFLIPFTLIITLIDLKIRKGSRRPLFLDE